MNNWQVYTTYKMTQLVIDMSMDLVDMSTMQIEQLLAYKK